MLNRYMPSKNIEIDFLKIDVEGHETEVLKGFNFNPWIPKIICIESVILWKGSPSCASYEAMLHKNNYFLAFKFRNNSYYQHTSAQKVEFIGVEKLISKYRIFIMIEPSDKYRLSYMAIESVLGSYPRLKSKVLDAMRLMYPFIAKHLPKLVS